MMQLVADSSVMVDRPHPRYPDVIYPLDDGYLAGTHSSGGGIDVWLGSGNRTQLSGVLCAVDKYKRDTENKVLLSCLLIERPSHEDEP